jgi:PAS domain-containing protein
VIIDDSEQILFVNTVLEEMAGIVRVEIIGHNARRLNIGAEDFDGARSFRNKSLRRAEGRMGCMRRAILGWLSGIWTRGAVIVTAWGLGVGRMVRPGLVTG